MNKIKIIPFFMLGMISIGLLYSIPYQNYIQLRSESNFINIKNLIKNNNLEDITKKNSNIIILYEDKQTLSSSNESNNTNNSNPNNQNTVVHRYVIKDKTNKSSSYLGYSYVTPNGFNFILVAIQNSEIKDTTSYCTTLDEHQKNITEKKHSILYDKDNHLFGLYFSKKDITVTKTLLEICLTIFAKEFKSLGLVFAENAVYIAGLLLAVSVLVYTTMFDKNGDFNLLVNISDLLTISSEEELKNYSKTHILKITFNGIDREIDLTKETRTVMKYYYKVKNRLQKFSKEKNIISIINMGNICVD